MQATLCFSPSILPTTVSSPKPSASPRISFTSPRLQTSMQRSTVIRSTALPIDNSSVDYSSPTSVFPAEACETIGGDACGADVYPEVKLESVITAKTTTTESIDREYLEYDNPKTVFPAEACDDLGGEFCAPEYQDGVFK